MRVDPLQVFDKAFELAARVGEPMRRALTEQGLNTGQAEVIYLLIQRGPMVQRELAQAIECSPRYVTGLVDALESTGLVERRAHPNDRRAFAVHLTDQGAETARWMSERRLEAAHAILDGVPDEELAAFTRVADRFLARISERG